MHASFLIIGGGLSGLAAAIRIARFNKNVLVLERHSRAGGLNSYYYRNNRLFETGLHAITNFAPRSNKKAPLNRLLRQLKINRDIFAIREQRESKILFDDCSLCFSNDFDLLCEEIHREFPEETDHFAAFLTYLDSVNPFKTTPFLSTRGVLSHYIKNPLLVDMLLCPVLYYGSSWENDIDFNQFTIMFRSIYQEGMFRPDGTIKDLLDILISTFENHGGTLRYSSRVKKIIHKNHNVSSVTLEDGEEITCDFLISTAGIDETKSLLGEKPAPAISSRLSFMENIFLLDASGDFKPPSQKTIIFYNRGGCFRYRKPDTPVDYSSGVICMPHNFKELTSRGDFFELRTTHLANAGFWYTVSTDKETYRQMKTDYRHKSCETAERILGSFSNRITFNDSFTPVTISRFTGKIEGAIYGSPNKVKDGTIGYKNLFLAGTDQGFLGIVGSMLSGVSIVNQHILTKI